VYKSTCNEIFACSICWIIFACHQLKSGGVIRKFLSLLIWQPISKLCLSIYLLHLFYIYYTLDFGIGVKSLPGLQWLIQVNIGDIVISSLLGLVFYLFVEAPLAKLIALL
jgi:hypothetical protein